MIHLPKVFHKDRRSFPSLEVCSATHSVEIAEQQLQRERRETFEKHTQETSTSNHFQIYSKTLQFTVEKIKEMKQRNTILRVCDSQTGPQTGNECTQDEHKSAHCCAIAEHVQWALTPTFRSSAVPLLLWARANNWPTWHDSPHHFLPSTPVEEQSLVTRKKKLLLNALPWLQRQSTSRHGMTFMVWSLLCYLSNLGYWRRLQWWLLSTRKIYSDDDIFLSSTVNGKRN